MRCPKCIEEGRLSKLYGGGGSITTDMGWTPFYDEGGIYHNHNPNRHSTSYQCSNGHVIHRSWTPRCPAGDYGGDEKIMVRE